MTEPVTLAFAGDVMLGRLVNEILPDRGYAYPWGNVLPVIQQADRFLINLECALTGRTERWHNGTYKTFYFRADPAVAATLTAGRVDFASLANNHIGDFEMEGLLDTIEILDRTGIAHAGAGANLEAARTPARLTAGDWRIAVVAFADHPAEWAATASAPGLNYTPVSLDDRHFREIESVLATAREQADLVIFSIHWGPNMRPRPPQAFREFARRVVTSGADIFWGHSAHVVQGMEFWHGKLILYDTGDFIDDYRIEPELRNDLSALFLVQVRPPAIERVELVPVQIGDRQANLATGTERDWFVQRIATLCSEMGTGVHDDGNRLVVQTS